MLFFEHHQLGEQAIAACVETLAAPIVGLLRRALCMLPQTPAPRIASASVSARLRGHTG
jgi:hypothetical protein